MKKLKSMDFNVKIENIPFTKDSEIGKVVKMSPPSPLLVVLADSIFCGLLISISIIPIGFKIASCIGTRRKR